MKKNTFFPNKQPPSSSSIAPPIGRDGSEQMRFARQRASTEKRNKVKRREASNTAVANQYNLFTQDYYDVVDKTGKILAVKMCEHTKQKYFPKSRK